MLFIYIYDVRNLIKLTGEDMDKNSINKLLTIGSVCLLLSAVIFICLCIFTDENNNIYSCIALGSLLLSNIFNLIKRQNSK